MRADSAVIVFGGTGAIGSTVVQHLLLRNVRPVLATYRSAPAPHVEGVRWVPFDAAAAGWEGDLRDALAQTDRGLAAMIFSIGIASSKQLVGETTAAEWLDLFATNCLGFVRAYQGVRDTARRCRTRVVVLGSDTTRVLGPGNGAYSASKAALEAVAATLAREEARYGVRVNVLAPSLVDSPLAGHLLRLKGVTDPAAYIGSQPWGRLITLPEVAEAAVSLALDSHWEYASGQVIRLASIG